MAYKNLLKKYEITEDQLKVGIDTVTKNIGNIVNVTVLIAVVDLLTSGDIDGNSTA